MSDPIPATPPPSPNRHDVHSPAVHAQLQILQSIISRMASNAAACKASAITIVAAILVLVADKGSRSFAIVGFLPVFLFLYLDSYYLHLERCFIGSYNTLLKHVRAGTATDEELFKVSPPRGLGTMCKGVLASMFSPAVFPFYMILLVLLTVVAIYLTPAVHEKLTESAPQTPSTVPALSGGASSTSSTTNLTTTRAATRP